MAFLCGYWLKGILELELAVKLPNCSMGLADEPKGRPVKGEKPVSPPSAFGWPEGLKKDNPGDKDCESRSCDDEPLARSAFSF
jgi:hypothetical protein